MCTNEAHTIHSWSLGNIKGEKLQIMEKDQCPNIWQWRREEAMMKPQPAQCGHSTARVPWKILQERGNNHKCLGYNSPRRVLRSTKGLLFSLHSCLQFSGLPTADTAPNSHAHPELSWSLPTLWGKTRHQSSPLKDLLHTGLGRDFIRAHKLKASRFKQAKFKHLKENMLTSQLQRNTSPV